VGDELLLTRRRDLPVGDELLLATPRRGPPVGDERRAPPGGPESLDKDTSTASRRPHRGHVERDGEDDWLREAAVPCGALRKVGARFGGTALRPMPGCCALAAAPISGNTGKGGERAVPRAIPRTCSAVAVTCCAVVPRAAGERGTRRTSRELADARPRLSSPASSSSPPHLLPATRRCHRHRLVARSRPDDAA